MMFESSSENRKSWNGRKMIWWCIPDVFEATDENDLEITMVVLRGGTHIDNDEEERSACVGTYFICFPEKLKYLTFGDSERSRSLSEILDAEYLANGTR